MKKQIFGLALVGLVASASAWTVKASDIDNWGLIADNGAGGTGISGPDADAGYAGSGGTSEVQDMTGACVGACKDGSSLWNIQSILTDAGDHLAMQFAVTDYTASSKTSQWPWANAGYIIAPIDTKAKPQQGVLLNGGPMGLTNTSVLSIKINYQAGKKLTLQLFAPPKASGAPGFEDATYGVPKKEITGTGADQTLNVNVKDIKASWGTFPSTRYAEAVGVGFLKVVAATVANNATFPAAEAAPSPFKFFCVADKADACGVGGSTSTPVVGKLGALSFSQDANGINFAGVNKSFSAEVVNSLGQVVKTAEVSAANSAVPTSGLENGVYFVRAAGEVASIVVR